MVATVARICTPAGVISVTTSTKLRGSGWHMGMSVEVCFAAWMPAKRATSRGLPLGLAGRAARTSAESSTKAEAEASRRVEDFWLTSTMWARPEGSKWLRAGASDIADPYWNWAQTGTSLAEFSGPRAAPDWPASEGARRFDRCD